MIEDEFGNMDAAEVRLTDETVEYLESRIASAVGSGIKRAAVATLRAVWK